MNQVSLEQVTLARELMLPPYRKALQFNMSNALKRQFLINRQEQSNVIISIYGKTGFGKSIIGWILGEFNCEVYNRDMSADNVFFENAELLKALETSGPGDITIKDEQVDVFGVGSVQIQSSLQNIEMTVREGEVSLVYIGPELRLHSHHYIIRPTFKMWRRRVSPVNKMFSWVFDGMKQGVAGNYPIGYLITGLPKGTKIDRGAKHHRDKIVWPEEFLRYKKKKHDFIKRVKLGQVSSGSDFFVDEVAENFIDTFEDIEGIDTKQELAAILESDKRYKRNFTEGQLKRIVELIRIKCKNRGIPMGLIRKRRS